MHHWAWRSFFLWFHLPRYQVSPVRLKPESNFLYNYLIRGRVWRGQRTDEHGSSTLRDSQQRTYNTMDKRGLVVDSRGTSRASLSSGCDGGPAPPRTAILIQTTRKGSLSGNSYSSGIGMSQPDLHNLDETGARDAADETGRCIPSSQQLQRKHQAHRVLPQASRILWSQPCRAVSRHCQPHGAVSSPFWLPCSLPGSQRSLAPEATQPAQSKDPQSGLPAHHLNVGVVARAGHHHSQRGRPKKSWTWKSMGTSQQSQLHQLRNAGRKETSWGDMRRMTTWKAALAVPQQKCLPIHMPGYLASTTRMAAQPQMKSLSEVTAGLPL